MLGHLLGFRNLNYGHKMTYPVGLGRVSTFYDCSRLSMNDMTQTPFARDEQVIPTYLFHLIASILSEQGADADQLTAGLDLTLAQLHQDNRLISFDDSITLISNAMRLSEHPSLGLLVGSRESLNDLGMMGYAIANAPSSDDILSIVERYYRTSTNLAGLQLTHHDQQLEIRTSPHHKVDAQLYRFLIEEHLSCNLKMIRDLTNADIHPIRVQFAYTEPENTELYREFFCCPLEFDSQHNALIIADDLLHLDNRNSNPITAKLALSLCEEILHQQNQQRSLVSKIKFILLSRSDNFPSITEIAGELSISERHLRRQLKDQGASFQGLLNDVRKELAIDYLKDSTLPIDTIAARLGFSDGSSFYRAFKKWTNHAPTYFRER